MDLDNDGNPDIFIVAGSVYPEVEKQLPQYPNKSPRILFRNMGDGTFEELGEAAGPGVMAAHSSRGCAFGDFDNDGDLDILIVNMNEPPSLLRNDLRGKNHWLKVKLIGHEIESQRHRGASVDALRWKDAGSVCDKPVELLFRERSSAPFWPGRGKDCGHGRLLAEWCGGAFQGCGGRSAGYDC